jgi:hypothetical protein
MKPLPCTVLALTALSRVAFAESYAPVAQLPVGGSPGAVVIADFDGDGHADLAVANGDDATVSILLNEGDGRFRAQVTYATSPLPLSIAVADFDGDGVPDLAVACAGGASPGTTVSVLRGNGDGTFAPKTDVPVFLGPWTVVAADVNGDGKPDLVSGNWLVYPVASSSVSVSLNDGNGGFESAMTDQTSYSAPRSLALGDLDGDGALDLVVANADAVGFTVQLGHGDGTFGATTAYAMDASPSALLLADFDGDGRLDVAVASESGNDVVVRLGNGDGTFGDPAGYAAGTFPGSIAAADLDGDGILDLVVGNGRDGASVFRGHGDGTFDAAVAIAVTAHPGALAVGDLNGDGRPDFAMTDHDHDTVDLFARDAVFTDGFEADINRR